MAVSKEELFARYKQLKAEGVNITLMELKKQMESETVNVSESAVTPTVQRGFSALSQSETSSPAKDSVSTPAALPKEPISPQPISPQNTWTTSYYKQSSEPQTSSGTYTSQNNESSTHNCEQIQQNYANNFSGNFAFGNNSEVTSSVIMPSVTTEDIQPKVLPTRNKFCLIGYPLGHSLSAYIHEAGFKSLNTNCTYELLETPPEQLVDRIKYLKANNFAGFNITIPLKLPIVLFLDEVDVSADLIGAVNTVVINPDRTMKGYNTDVLGFRRAIPDDITLAGKTVAILGTGGAARAAITALAQEQVKSIKIYTRNVPNTLELLKYLRKKFPFIEFNSFQIERLRDLSEVDILVNTTPIGMLGRAADLTPVEERELITLPKGALIYDVIYNPRKTVLLKLAQKHGYRTINGLDMLVYQALAAEQIWFGKTPDFKDMKIAALENI